MNSKTELYRKLHLYAREFRGCGYAFRQALKIGNNRHVSRRLADISEIHRSFGTYLEQRRAFISDETAIAALNELEKTLRDEEKRFEKIMRDAGRLELVLEPLVSIKQEP